MKKLFASILLTVATLDQSAYSATPKHNKVTETESLANLEAHIMVELGNDGKKIQEMCAEGKSGIRAASGRYCDTSSTCFLARSLCYQYYMETDSKFFNDKNKSDFTTMSPSENATTKEAQQALHFAEQALDQLCNTTYEKTPTCNFYRSHCAQKCRKKFGHDANYIVHSNLESLKNEIKTEYQIKEESIGNIFPQIITKMGVRNYFPFIPDTV